MKERPRAYAVATWCNQETTDRMVMAYSAEDAVFQVEMELKKCSPRMSYITSVRPWGVADNI